MRLKRKKERKKNGKTKKNAKKVEGRNPKYKRV